MQMIDVLKRLAELDATNPNVETTKIKQEDSLVTLSNVEGSPEALTESASLNINADNGPELTGMLKDLMDLAGVSKVSDHPAFGGHREIELEPAHNVEIEPMAAPQSAGGSMADLIGKMDTLNVPDEEHGHEHGEETDEGSCNICGKADCECEKEEGPCTVCNEEPCSCDHEEESADWDNTPKPEIEPHDYGNKQVTPKPQGLKQRVGDNPYESIAAKLLKDYQEFVAEGEKKTMSRAAKGYEKYGKDGMKALAKAGKEGKDLDKVRDKYNKYD
jgi:hypothetical protein